MPLFRRAATAPDPNAPPSLFEWKNLVNALVIATLSAGALAATLYAPRWPIPCAIIALFIVAFASVLRISLITTSVITPTVRLVSQERIATTATVAPDTTLVTHGAAITVVVDPPAPTAGTQPLPSFAATPKPRAPSGRFAGEVEPVAITHE